MNKHKKFILEIEKAIAQFCRDLPPKPKGIYEPLKFALGNGGKRIRPLMVLFANHLFGGKIKDAIPAALAVELFHNFTLIHDDIMDNARIRRNRPSVHAKWNVNTAILAGDAMQVLAYSILERSKPEHLQQLMQVFSKTSLEVCEGQQEDMDFETRKSISRSEYLKMIEKKTAVLLAASLAMGGITASAGKKDIDRLYLFGKNLGIAFQIRDDILDIYGDRKKFGKKKGGDIEAGKKTFPFVVAMETAGRQQKKILIKLMYNKKLRGPDKIRKVIAVYDKLRIRNKIFSSDELYMKRALKDLLTNSRSADLVAFVDKLNRRVT